MATFQEGSCDLLKWGNGDVTVKKLRNGELNTREREFKSRFQALIMRLRIREKRKKNYIEQGNDKKCINTKRK